jgi:hypothetical protein
MTWDDPKDYIRHLEKRGFRYLARGASATVLGHPRSNRVIKVIEWPTDPWPQYAEWCFNNPQPFAPVIHSLKWHLDDNGAPLFCVAVMDRLAQTWRDARVEEHYNTYTCPLLNKSQCETLNDICSNPTYKGIIHSSLAKELWPELQRFLCHLNAAIPTASNMLDLHAANWMLDDQGHLFLIDPFSGDMGSSPTRLKRNLTSSSKRLAA